jgi:hypothetical protein
MSLRDQPALFGAADVCIIIKLIGGKRLATARAALNYMRQLRCKVLVTIEVWAKRKSDIRATTEHTSGALAPGAAEENGQPYRDQVLL